MARRAILIVLDSVGAGELPDAAAYGDEGSHTLGNMARAVPLRRSLRPPASWSCSIPLRSCAGLPRQRLQGDGCHRDRIHGGYH